MLNTRTSTYQSQINFFVKPLQNQKSPSKKCANAYTFGFNGQENDNEVEGDGNCIAYELRIYDPRIGRFTSVDPRTREYAWQSTYAYHLNSPISTMDFFGGGGPYDPEAAGETDPGGTPANNTPSTGTVDALFKESGGLGSFSKTPSAYTMGSLQTGNFTFGGNSSKDKLNRFVNTNTMFNVGEGAITPENFVNTMLGNFKYGLGPENYVFPTNGSVSNAMRNSPIVANAMFDWVNSNVDNINMGGDLTSLTKGYGYGLDDQVSTLMNQGGILNVENFVGSGYVAIKPMNKDQIMVTVFNVTSITSGDYSKHFKSGGYPVSTVRDPNKLSGNAGYSNISQTFSFTISVQAVVGASSILSGVK